MKNYYIKNFKDNTVLSVKRVQNDKERYLKLKLDTKKLHKCSYCLCFKKVCFSCVNNCSNDNLCLYCVNAILEHNIMKTKKQDIFKVVQCKFNLIRFIKSIFYVLNIKFFNINYKQSKICYSQDMKMFEIYAI